MPGVAADAYERKPPSPLDESARARQAAAGRAGFGGRPLARPPHRAAIWPL